MHESKSFSSGWIIWALFWLGVFSGYELIAMEHAEQEARYQAVSWQQTPTWEQVGLRWEL